MQLETIQANCIQNRGNITFITPMYRIFVKLCNMDLKGQNVKSLEVKNLQEVPCKGLVINNGECEATKWQNY